MSLIARIWLTRALCAAAFMGLIALLVSAWPPALPCLAAAAVFCAVCALSVSCDTELSCPLCGRRYGPRILFSMRCAHCGGSVPHGIRSRFPLARTALLVLCAVCALYCRPMRLSPPHTNEPIYLSVTIALPTEVVKDDGAYYGVPRVKTAALEFAPGSPEAKAVSQLLGGFVFHRCTETLTGSTSIHGEGGASAYVDAGGLSLSAHGVAHIFIDGRVYHAGWLDPGAGAGLTEALAALVPESRFEVSP